MDIVNLLISLVSGAVGGNVAGAVASDKNLGPIFNTVAGLIGGGAGEYILKALGFLATTGAATAANAAGTAGGFDIASLLASVGISGVSGAVLTGLITFIKSAMDKK